MAEETRKMVRMLATDISGEMKLGRALRKIKGVSFMFSNAVCISAGIDKNKKIGDLGEEELKKIESLVKSPQMPPWMLNHRRDIETGSNLHFIGPALDLKKREDINLLKKMHSYKGVRHELGQPVRGQRTRSSFRTHATVGVSKKAIRQPAKKEAEKK
ncbi:MAG TPA: 30S ribosomal protein S13 [archaeon]|nr:30S ribosomal protein S13 [archaeon]